MKLFEEQTVIDSETGLPMTPERMAEVRNMLLAEGVSVTVAPEAQADFEAEGISLHAVQAEIFEQLGGKLS